MSYVEANRIDIAFQDRAQVLICGSTLFASQLALESAQAGLTTTLAMERLHPFSEAIHCLNPWVDRERANSNTGLLARTLADKSLTKVNGDRLYFSMTEAAIEMEDRLCEAGVHIFYNAPVVGSLCSDEELRGVVFGGKPGLFAIEATLIVDATLEATVARTLGVPMVRVESSDNLDRFHYSVERCSRSGCDEETFMYRTKNGIEMQVESRDFYTHYTMSYVPSEEGPLQYANDFQKLYSLALEYTPNLPSLQFRAADGYLRRGLARVDAVNGVVPSFPNLRVFSPMGIPSNRDGQLSLLDHEFLFHAFPKELRKDLLDSLGHPPMPTGPRPVYRFCNESVLADDRSLTPCVTDPQALFPGMERAEIVFSAPAAMGSHRLGVIGGGTSGVAAAIQAADLEMDTICIEAAAELGGTNTVGGVSKLWYGKRIRGFSDFYRSAGAENDGLNAVPFFRRATASHNLFYLPVTPACGVAVANGTICSVYIATPLGLSAIDVDYVIDATGDASLAAWAGCDYHFGSERDEVTLWASLGSFEHGKSEGLRQFLTPLDERNPEDLRRFMHAMRRFDNRKPVTSFMVTPRESRHIHSEKCVTMLDVMAERRFADGVFRFRSNLDLKGNASSDISHMGVASRTRFRNHEITMPYAAMIPDQLENTLVVGKAYASTSDAMSLARMQRDLARMGCAAAYAMQQCVETSIAPRSIDIARLQSALLAKGIMEATDAATDDLGIEAGTAELLAQIAAAVSLEESLTPTAQLLLLDYVNGFQPPDDVDATNLSVARYLCIQKDDRGIQAFEQRLDAWLKTINGLIPEQDRIPDSYDHMLPDQALAPEPLYILMALALAGSQAVLPACDRIVELVVADETLNFNSLWAYVFAVGYSCERVAQPKNIRVLERLLDCDRLDVALQRRGADCRESGNTERERLVYLRLCLLRALSRCGSLRGYRGLTEFLQSAHASFARHARAELIALTGKDYLFDVDKWQIYLETLREPILPYPYDRSLA